MKIKNFSDYRNFINDSYHCLQLNSEYNRLNSVRFFIIEYIKYSIIGYRKIGG